jgi:hypothetical protein
MRVPNTPMQLDNPDSRSFDSVGVIILTMCGTLAGIAWYFVMRWLFRLIHLLPRNGH